MSANIYTTESLLIGKAYRSRTLEGITQDAEIHPAPIWYDGATAYLVRVRPTHGFRDQYRTVAVKDNN